MKVLGVGEADHDYSEEELEKLSKTNGGIVSSKFIPFNELDDETLGIIFESSPDWIIEHRPDWVKLHHPELMN